MAQRTVDSWEQLQANIESILESINDNSQLAQAAAANPLLALEELGYEIEPAARTEIARRIRFSPRTAVRLRQLEEEVADIAGRAVDLDSAEDVRRLLFEELKLEVPDDSGNAGGKYRQAAPAKGGGPALDTRPLPPDLSTVGTRADPLRALEGRHAVMDPLLEYRQLEASTPRLAPRQAYEQLRAGKLRLGINGIKGRLQGQPPAPDVDKAVEGGAAGVLNLNEATAADLEQVPGIGPALAERIILYRTAYGPFADVNTLTKIKGIGSDLLSRVRSHLTV